ncbi:MAG: CDP-alcohol phosphatidyltransferase family protein, partial [Frankiaceae bacterium]
LVRWGVRPGHVTAAGVALSGLAVPAAAGGRRLPLAAAGTVAAAALLDNVDGCVAILSGRVSPFGVVIDSVADRTSDAVLAGALAAAGAPPPLAAAAIGGLLSLEYTRAVARAAGFTEIGTVTVGERPTRLIVVCAGLVCAGLFPRRRAGFAAAAAAAVAGLALTGQAQLLAVVRGALR